MSDDLRILDLVQEALDSGRSPEEICQACPGLLTEVRERVEECKRVNARLAALFPSSAATEPVGRSEPAPGKLPDIPGYHVESVLGHGGMGVVYRAKHQKLHRVVALKMLLSGAYASTLELTRFMREAEAIAGLQHANIVQVYDAGEWDGKPYFTMEYMEGGDLRRKLGGVPLPPMEAARLTAILAGAMHVAHGAGIVHRDLKPAKVLLDRYGRPKITDFGLARRVETDQTLTQSGMRVGTPSYMAPEQAAGSRTAAVGPAADVYALGAILYEMLTGRPPFRADTASETERQLLSQEPAAPSKLNAKVPRDLETICLKCLQKEPAARYENAAELAEDLGRFRDGRPIRARPVRLPTRTWRWCRRKPAAAALVGATVLFTVALLGGGLWLTVQQGHRRQAMEADLRDVVELQQQARWTEARDALQRAEARLNGRGAGDLNRRINQARHDLDLVIELDRIRLSRVTSGSLVSRLSRITSGNWEFYRTKADRDYEKAFGDPDLVKASEPVDIAAARIHASTVRVALMAALDDWAVCATDKGRRDWLLAVARTIDPDPHGWCDRVRDPATWEDPTALAALAQTAPVSGPSVSLLLALGERLGASGGDAPAFLRRVQTEHPADFWVNLILGDALLASAPVEAGGYYRAALASRPGAAVAYTAMGDALRAQNLRDEALEYYQRAVQIDPSYARGHTNLGNVLNDLGRIDEATACYRRALEVDPTYPWAHFDLANTLRDAGRLDEAIEHYRQYLAVDSTHSYVAHLVRADPVRKGGGEEVRLKWKKSLAADPPEHDAWFGYAELCLFLGNEEEYRQARRDLLRRFGTTSDPYVAERVSRAVLLFPPSEDELRAGTALAERAVAAKATTAQWIYPYFLFAQGLAEYRQGRFDSAIAIMSADAGTVMRPAPRLVIAMAQYRKGREQEARTTLASEVPRFDWDLAHAFSRDQWIWHVLRREAETMIIPNAAAFLQGKYEPRDNAERLALLGVCQFNNRTCASAQLYADAFAADSTLAGDPTFDHRYNAARWAALAGCGRGEDATGLGEPEKQRWRNQSREWLKSDLAARVRAFDADPTAARAGVRNALTRWQEDPYLASLRDPDQLDKLNVEDRKECLALWTEVAAVLARTVK